MKTFKIAKFCKIFTLYFIFHILYFNTQHILSKKNFQDMSLSIRDYAIMKVVQASHHQGDVRYGASISMQCLCTSIISVSLTLFKLPGLWSEFDLDCILGKEDQLFKKLSWWKFCHKSLR